MSPKPRGSLHRSLFYLLGNSPLMRDHPTHYRSLLATWYKERHEDGPSCFLESPGCSSTCRIRRCSMRSTMQSSRNQDKSPTTALHFLEETMIRVLGKGFCPCMIMNTSTILAGRQNLAIPSARLAYQPPLIAIDKAPTSHLVRCTLRSLSGSRIPVVPTCCRIL